MGRPRKNLTEEIRDFKVQETQEVNGNQVLEPIFNRIGLAIITSPETGLKHLVEIPLNDNLEVGTPKIVSEGDGRDVINERFRIKAATDIL